MTDTAVALRADTRARILEAAFEAVRAYGLSRMTVEDVAQRAGLSRQTIYRYFPSKDDLVVALVMRELERFLDGVREVYAAHPDLEEAAFRAIAFVFRYAREHPLLDRLLATEQETFLPYVTTRGLPLIERAREAVAELVAARAPEADPELLEGYLDLSVRAVVSHILTPSDRDPRAVARTLARLLALVARGREARA